MCQMETYADLWYIAKKIRHKGLMQEISKRIAVSIDTQPIPNDLWIRLHMICAKTLVQSLSKEYIQSAVSRLKLLSTVLPKLLLPEIVPESSKEETVPMQLIELEHEELLRDAFKTSLVQSVASPELGSYERQNLITSVLVKDFNEFFGQKKGEGYRKTIKGNIYQSAFELQKSIFVEIARVEHDPSKKIIRTSRPSLTENFKPKTSASKGLGDSKIGTECFVVSTDCSYLYYLGKISVSHGIDLKMGLQALKECMGILHLLCQEDSRMYYKARFWMAEAMIKLDKKPEALSIFTEIKGYIEQNVPSLQNRLQNNINGIKRIQKK